MTLDRRPHVSKKLNVSLPKFSFKFSTLFSCFLIPWVFIFIIFFAKTYSKNYLFSLIFLQDLPIYSESILKIYLFPRNPSQRSTYLLRIRLALSEVFVWWTVNDMNMCRLMTSLVESQVVVERVDWFDVPSVVW